MIFFSQWNLRALYRVSPLFEFCLHRWFWQNCQIDFSMLIHAFVKIDTWISSTFAKQNQAVWPRLQSLLNLLLWTKGGEWVNYSMPWDRCAFGNVFFLKSCFMRHVGGGVKYFINMIDPRWIKQYSLHDQQFFVVLLLLHFRENQISVSAIMLLTSSVRFTTRSILNIYNKKHESPRISNLREKYRCRIMFEGFFSDSLDFLNSHNFFTQHNTF